MSKISIGIRATLVVCMFITAIEGTGFAGALKLDHPSTQRAGLKNILYHDGTYEGTLELDAEYATSALLILEDYNPLVVESAANATVTLLPGWEGAYGFGMYGIKLDIPHPARVVVHLRESPPPTRALAVSNAEISAYATALIARKSKFPAQAKEFRKWQRIWRLNLAARLMNGEVPPRVPLDVVVLEEKDCGSFTLRTIKYHSQADRMNTAILALPNGLTKVPLLLALHGHEGPWGSADPAAFTLGHADDFCAYFAIRGWAVLEPATMDHKLQHPGWTLEGEWTWDAIVALNYGISVPIIDPHRISVCGLSTGGYLALNVLALDERVGAGVVAGALTTWNHIRKHTRIPPACDCGILSQLGDYLEQCDWAALAAPKPVLFQYGLKDASFCPGASEQLLNLNFNTSVMPQQEFDLEFNEIQRAYRISGQSSNVALLIHPGGHNVDAEAAFRWLSDRLR